MTWTQYIILTLLFAFDGFVRSTGFFSAAHTCYPLLLELIIDLFGSKKPIIEKIKKASQKIARIIVGSIIFLFPMFFLQHRVYNIYCKQTGVIEYPSFCQKLIPDYYAYIQKEFWKVETLSFIRQGKPEQAYFMVLSFPVWLYFLYKYIKKNKSLFNIATGNIFRFFNRRNFKDNQIVMYPVFVTTLIIGLYSFLFANPCSIDRFFSSMPFYSIALAEFYQFCKNQNKVLWVLVLANLVTRYSVNVFLTIGLFQPA